MEDNLLYIQNVAKKMGLWSIFLFFWHGCGKIKQHLLERAVPNMLYLWVH